MIARVPELGTIDNKKISALIGLALFNHDSGHMSRKRHIYGGRATVRTLLYMGAVCATRHNPMIKRFYMRLLSAGKPKKVALTACAHKLLVIINAMVKNNSSWKENYDTTA